MYTINSCRNNLIISPFLWLLLHYKHLCWSNVRWEFVLLSILHNQSGSLNGLLGPHALVYKSSSRVRVITLYIYYLYSVALSIGAATCFSSICTSSLCKGGRSSLWHKSDIHCQCFQYTGNILYTEFMQSDSNSFWGDVVFDSFNNASWMKTASIVYQIYIKQLHIIIINMFRDHRALILTYTYIFILSKWYYLSINIKGFPSK